MTRRLLIFACAALTVLIAAAGARAHEVRPAFLELTEREPGRFDVLWKVPVIGQGTPLAGDDTPHEADAVAAIEPEAPQTMPCGCPSPWALGLTLGAMPIHPTLPQHATPVGARRLERISGAEIRRWTIDTGERGLDGWTCVVHGLSATSSDVLVRVALLDGHVVTRVLRPDAPSFTFAAAERVPVAGYLRLGVEHILMGIDHLLFVAGLLLLVRGFGRLVKTITAFTVAHTVTLSLATLGVVHIPPGPVEAVIALSIVFVAREIVQQRRGAAPSLAVRQPWLIAFSFGLLHGFGFAGALGEVGLPPGEIPLALLLFSAGVEIGHFAFVGAVLALVAACRRVRWRVPRWASPIPAYGIGSIAAFWLVMRVIAIW
jgi:hypothetical protein